MHLCICVSEERGDGEGAGSRVLSLLSYTLKYISLAEEGGAGTGALSLLSYTLKYISLADVGILCQVGLR